MSINDTLNKIQAITDSVCNYSSKLESNIEQWSNHICDTILKLEAQQTGTQQSSSRHDYCTNIAFPVLNDRCINIRQKTQEIGTQMTTYNMQDLNNKVLDGQAKIVRIVSISQLIIPTMILKLQSNLKQKEAQLKSQLSSAEKALTKTKQKLNHEEKKRALEYVKRKRAML